MQPAANEQDKSYCRGDNVLPTRVISLDAAISAAAIRDESALGHRSTELKAPYPVHATSEEEPSAFSVDVLAPQLFSVHTEGEDEDEGDEAENSLFEGVHAPQIFSMHIEDEDESVGECPLPEPTYTKAQLKIGMDMASQNTIEQMNKDIVEPLQRTHEHLTGLVQQLRDRLHDLEVPTLLSVDELPFHDCEENATDISPVLMAASTCATAPADAPSLTALAYTPGSGGLKEPTRPPPAFLMFVQEKRSAIKGDMGEVYKELTKLWADLDIDTKDSYNTKAKELLDKYLVEMAAFKESEAQKPKRKNRRR